MSNNDYSPAANTLSIAFDNGNGVGSSIQFTYHGVITEGEAMNLQVQQGKDEYDDNKYEIKAEKFGQDNWKMWYNKFKKQGLF